MNQQNLKSMLLVTSTWDRQQTFKMIPVTKECPYLEVVYMPDEQVLAIVSTQVKQTFHMMPKLDENGDPAPRKNGGKGPEGPYKRSRVSVETNYEYYIKDKKEAMQFVDMFSINLEDFGPDKLVTIMYPEKAEKQVHTMTLQS